MGRSERPFNVFLLRKCGEAMDMGA